MTLRIKGATTIKGLTSVRSSAFIGNGLVGFWQMNGDVTDASGNGYNGTAIGAPTYSFGALANAITLNGSSQYVTISGASAFSFVNATFTATAWVNTTSAAFGIVFGMDGTNEPGWSIGVLGTGVFAGGSKTSAGINVVALSSTATVNNGAWRHVALVCTTNTTTAASNSAALYVDGVADGSATGSVYTYSSPPNPSLTYIGGRTNNAGGIQNYFSGSIDDVRIYNRGLTAAEIALIAAKSG